jgi:hypothetical protein
MSGMSGRPGAVPLCQGNNILGPQVFAMGPFSIGLLGEGIIKIRRSRSLRIKLAYYPVLAKGAAQVASGKAQGDDLGAGTEVVEGFFLDRVPRDGGDIAGVGEDDFPPHVFTGSAEPPAPHRDMAPVGTEPAD